MRENILIISCPTDVIWEQVQKYLINIGIDWAGNQKYLRFSEICGGESSVIYVQSESVARSKYYVMRYGRNETVPHPPVSFEQFMEIYLPYLSNMKSLKSKKPFLEEARKIWEK